MLACERCCSRINVVFFVICNFFGQNVLISQDYTCMLHVWRGNVELEITNLLKNHKILPYQRHSVI